MGVGLALPEIDYRPSFPEGQRFEFTPRYLKAPNGVPSRFYGYHPHL